MSENYKAPSRRIGERYGMDFLWNDWGLVGHASLSDKLLEGSKVDSITAQAMIWNHVLAIEPRFIDLDPWWAVMGVVSQYNFDDIEYFCTINPWARDKNVELEQKKRDWDGQGWIMSPKTLAKVLEFEKDKIAA